MPKAKKKKQPIRKLKVVSLKTKNLEELKNAEIVFNHALGSVNKFYEIYQKSRKGARGTTTHQEQDLLRAMLVFSCSGLDAVTKQLIKDALPTILNKDEGAKSQFTKFVARNMRKSSLNEDLEKDVSVDLNLLASVLTDTEPREYLSVLLQKSLSADSLQSRDQLLKVASHFAITKEEFLNKPDDTKKAFDVRNQVIHEMDVDFDGHKRRRQRGTMEMTKYSQNVLDTAAKLINVIASRIDT